MSFVDLCLYKYAFKTKKKPERNRNCRVRMRNIFLHHDTEERRTKSKWETYYILYTRILSIYKWAYIYTYIFKAEENNSKNQGTLLVEPVTVNTSDRNSLYITLAKDLYRRRSSYRI